MARVKRGAAPRQRRKKILKAAKGYWGGRHRLYRTAKEAVVRAGQYAYHDRRQRKREFRRLWVARINAAARESGLTYSRFMEGVAKAVHDGAAFGQIVDAAKAALT
jgi:large subunit ribosomal protein L20